MNILEALFTDLIPAPRGRGSRKKGQPPAGSFDVWIQTGPNTAAEADARRLWTGAPWTSALVLANTFGLVAWHTGCPGPMRLIITKAGDSPADLNYVALLLYTFGTRVRRVMHLVDYRSRNTTETTVMDYSE